MPWYPPWQGCWDSHGASNLALILFEQCFILLQSYTRYLKLFLWHKYWDKLCLLLYIVYHLYKLSNVKFSFKVLYSFYLYYIVMGYGKITGYCGFINIGTEVQWNFAMFILINSSNCWHFLALQTVNKSATNSGEVHFNCRVR